jgi:lysozyme family protein
MLMADFNAFFPTLLRFEGGFVDDPADPWGATNKGITLQTFDSYARRLPGIDPTLEALKQAFVRSTESTTTDWKRT